MSECVDVTVGGPLSVVRCPWSVVSVEPPNKRRLREPETPMLPRMSILEGYRSRNVLSDDAARQLRPYLLWSVRARWSAWLRCWRLRTWWRLYPVKGRLDPAGEIV
jgi:hypothetical protein